MPTKKLTLITLIFLCISLITSIASAADYDLSKAIVIGKGPHMVIEFTDPDCPFCRRASQYFDSRKDITRYVFFNPLASHPNAKKKVQYVLSSHDMVRAYHEAMSGELDRLPVDGLPVSPKGIKLQETQQEIARKAGFNATPTFIISGRIIEGFELPKIEGVLGKR